MGTVTHSRRHVAHILPYDAVGGTEVATLRVARAVEQRGFRSTAFCTPVADPVAALFEAAGVDTARYPAVEPSFRRPWPFLAAALRLARTLATREVDLVHCADIHAAPLAGLAGRLARLPVLCHVRNRYEDLGARERRLLLPVHHFAFVSQHTRDGFGLPVSPRRGTVVYDGVKLPALDGTRAAAASVRAEFGIPEDVALVGMVARVAAQKDFVTLVKAAARIVQTDPRVRFLIVGDHSSAATYRAHYAMVVRTLAELGISDHFVFTDFRSDVPRFLAALDLFVLSTHWEGLPLVILEAMSYGKPVVATEVDGVPEAVRNGQTGLLVPHQDSEALAAQILAVLRGPALAERLGCAGRERIREHFGPEQFAGSLETLYRTLLGPTDRPIESESRIATTAQAGFRT